MIISRPCLLASASLVSLSIAASASASPAAKPRPQHSFYRVNVSVTGIDGTSDPTTYSLVLEETTRGRISTGINMPDGVGANGATSRQRIGLDVELSYELRGEVVILQGEIEMSSVDPTTATRTSPTFRSLRASATAPIVGGKVTPFASLYDVSTKRRYEVTVAATKVM